MSFHTALHRVGPCVTGALLLAAFVNATAKDFNVMEATVADVQAAYKAHTLTAHQLVQMYLDRIAAYDQKGPAIDCIVTVNTKALEEADKLDAEFAKTGKFVGPMHGVPILVKDEIDTAGMPTTLGTTIFKDYRPPLDAFENGAGFRYFGILSAITRNCTSSTVNSHTRDLLRVTVSGYKDVTRTSSA